MPRSLVRQLPGFGLGLALVALLAVLLLTGPVRWGGGASAQDAPETAAATPTPPATLSVSGHGSVILTPDTASFVVGVVTNEDTLAEAQAEATTQMEAIIAAVKAAGIEDRDIQTTNYSVSLIYDYDDNGRATRVIGYEVSNQVSVTVRDIDALGGLLDAVVAAGANSVYGISFFVDDTTAAASQARTMAVEDAMRKADELAAAAGLEVARVTYITESYSPPPTPYYAPSAGVADEAARASVPVQAGSSEVSVDVQMAFELREAAS
jgi:uncharacterized protein YggE